MSAVVNGSISGVPFVNVFGFVLNGDFDSTVSDFVGDLIKNAWAANLVSSLVDEYAVSSITVTDLRTETGGQIEYTDTEDMTGTDSNQGLPFQSCALVSWGTAVRGRSYRGRTYLGGFAEENSNGRIIDAGLVTAIEGWVGDMTAFAGFLGVISRYETVMGVPHQLREPAIITPVTSGIVHPSWRTQRRRAAAVD